MKLNVILPWILVLGLSAGLGAVYVKSNAKDTELARLQTENKELEQLRTDLAAAQEKAQIPADQVIVSKKDKEELIKLRGEVGKLRTENQKFVKDLAASQNLAEAAKAQANDAIRLAQNATVQANAVVTANRTAANLDAQRNACINNLRQIDGAKQQWALENNKPAEAAPTAQEIAPYLKNTAVPACPAGGTYTIGPVSQAPTCTVPGHALQ